VTGAPSPTEGFAVAGPTDSSLFLSWKVVLSPDPLRRKLDDCSMLVLSTVFCNLSGEAIDDDWNAEDELSPNEDLATGFVIGLEAADDEPNLYDFFGSDEAVPEPLVDDVRGPRSNW
jgi:hypothetical protein